MILNYSYFIYWQRTIVYRLTNLITLCLCFVDFLRLQMLFQIYRLGGMRRLLHPHRYLQLYQEGIVLNH